MRRSIIETRQVRPSDGAFLQVCQWVAIDNMGYRFGGSTAQEAQALATEYHHPTHTSRERKGRVSHPERTQPSPRTKWPMKGAQK